jgi:hypothetical protein
VIRPAARRLAACLAAGLGTVALIPFSVGSASPAAAAEAADETPLQVSIQSLTPSTLPRKGAVIVTGRITNTSDSTWTGLNVYLFTSATPMLTSDELQAASATDPTAEVGARLTDTGLFDSVPDLAPGESTGYTLSVPRRDLRISGEPGVYWLGVHVLGANELGRDGVADGRARTFMPLMRPRGPRTRLSLVMPVKGKVRRQTDGSLTDLSAWQHLLGPEGRLTRLVQMGETTRSTHTTWVVDPAVVDAARSVASDNPPLSTEPSEGTPKGQLSASPSPSGSPTESPSGSPTGTGTDSGLSEQARKAADWLTEFGQQARRHPVMTVPYGGLDVASTLRKDFLPLYQQAKDMSTETLRSLNVDSTPVVAPPGGFLPRVALARLDDAETVLLSDRALPSAVRPALTSSQGPRVVLTDSSAGRGGPSPTPQFDALAVRQRILSEAALHALSPDRRQPLVVSTPQFWDPGSDWRTADFFPGLDVPWLEPVDLASVADSAGPVPGVSTDTTDSLVYPVRQRRAELPFGNLLATKELSGTGAVLDGLLSRNDTVHDAVTKSAMFASSTSARRRPHAAALLARDTTRQLRFLMEKVRIDGPSFVTMSSEEGTFAVTIVNDLDATVTVGIKAQSVGGSSALLIDSPDPVDIGPGQRASVRLRASTQDIGVHSVTLMPTNGDGEPLGNLTRFSVRSSKVGLVIWVIMGAGAAILFVTVGIRVTRRVRARVRIPRGRLEDEPS